MKVILLNQQDANDLLAMICNDQVVIASSRAARVHQLQAILSAEPLESGCGHVCLECLARNAQLATRYRREVTP